MRWSLELALCLGVLLSSCALFQVEGEFVWVDDYAPPPPPPRAPGYVIEPGDLLDIRVFGQENMSARARVRHDGKVSLPMLSDVHAAGYTPVVLSQQLQSRLKDFINNPLVTISLEERRPLTISIVGEVARPGAYPLEPGAGPLAALAAAGGFTEFAHKDRIFVLRRDDRDRPLRIRFSYDKLTRAQGRSAAFALAHGDVIVIE